MCAELSSEITANNESKGCTAGMAHAYVVVVFPR